MIMTTMILTTMIRATMIMTTVITLMKVLLILKSFFEDIQETFKDQEELEKILSAAGLLERYEEYRPKPKPTRRPNMFSNLFRGFSNRNQQIVVNRCVDRWVCFFPVCTSPWVIENCKKTCGLCDEEA